MKQLTEAELLRFDFAVRCQVAASYLWDGKSVSMSSEQLREYHVTPHKAVEELSVYVRAEESEACWEASSLYGGSRRRRTWTVYCTRKGDSYSFKAVAK